MAEYRLGQVEARFADLIWERAPIPSGALVELCREQLGWQKSTTYTVLRRLCQRGLFQNEEGVVTPLIGREEFFARQSEDVLNESFSGSLPHFVAAFTARNQLTEKEIEELQRLIEAQRR